MKPIPEYGDLMKLEDFERSCKQGCFIDYDGSGCYSDGKQMSDKDIIPSDVINGKVDRSWSHVVWFNR